MPRPKKQTREERLEKRRLYERRRKERIKSNVATREEFLRKDRERYARKKAAGLIVSRHQMTPSKLRILRRRNKESAAAYYRRKKNRVAAAPIALHADPLDETIGDLVEDEPEQPVPNRSDQDCNNPGQYTSRQDTPSSTTRASRCSTLRRSLRLNSNNGISMNIPPQRTSTPEATSSHRIYTSSPRQTPLTTHLNFVGNNYPGPSTSQESNPSSSLRPTRRSVLRRYLRMNSNSSIGSDIQHNIDNFVVTSTNCVQLSGTQQITTGLSSIDSTLCPNSPVSESSITSVEFKRGLKNKFRKYQRTKSKLITELQNKLIQVSKEKEMFKKRCVRLQSNYINLKRGTQNVEKRAVKVVKPVKKNRTLARVVKFLEDDENSTLCPGKNDTVSRHGLKKQKRLLTDTLKNLHLKYLESGEAPISYSTFSRLKPFWVTQPNVNARNTCLCEKHENMKLLIESLKRNRVIKENTISDVLSSICCSKDNINCLQRICQSCKNRDIDYQEFDNAVHVAYWSWEKNKSTYVKNNVEKSAIKVEKVRHWVKPLELIKKFENSLKPFLKHCVNNKNQNQAFKTLKENMTPEDCIIQIDFSENYNAKFGSEIQSLHFGGSRKQFTLHTVVIYFKLNNETSKTQSFCSVSTSLRHDAAAVWAHLVPVLREIEITAPLVRNLYIISDSPSAQYRNKKILYIISQLSSYCPMLTHIVWNYCECGHGKSAADGVGGVLKRTLDKQVSYQNDITNIESLVQTLKSSVKGVKIEIVEDYLVTEKDWLLPKDLKTFTGTMKVHQVVWSKESGNRLALRHLSCIEKECLNETIRCLHGKHLGFHDFPETQSSTSVKTTNTAQLHPIQLSDKLALRPKPSKEKKLPKDLQQSSVINKPLKQSIRNIKISVIKPSTSQSPIGKSNKQEETGNESSMIPKSLLEKYENFAELSTPSCSFLENADTGLIEKYEQNSNIDSEEEIKIKVKRRTVRIISSSSSDSNIF